MPAPEAENERRMREYIGAWNDHDVDAIVSFVSDDCETFPPDQLREICEGWFAAFPDLTHEIEELAADGGWVLGRATLRGTHEGPYRGIPPTGTGIEVSDHFSTRFVDGRIVEHHAVADTTSLLEQLGAAVPTDRSRRTAANEALVRRYFEALNDRDREAFRETMTEDFTYGDIQSREEMIESDFRWLEAMDLTWDVRAIHATGEFVTTRVRASGTHRGEILGLEPTGESFEVTAITVARVEDGRIAEWWAEWDFAGLLDRIGAIDAPTYGD